MQHNLLFAVVIVLVLVVGVALFRARPNLSYHIVGGRPTLHFADHPNSPFQVRSKLNYFNVGDQPTLRFAVHPNAVAYREYIMSVPVQGMSQPLTGVIDTGSWAGVFGEDLPDQSKKRISQRYSAGSSSFYKGQITLTGNQPVIVGGGNRMGAKATRLGSNGIVGLLPSTTLFSGLPSFVSSLGVSQVNIRLTPTINGPAFVEFDGSIQPYGEPIYTAMSPIPTRVAVTVVKITALGPKGYLRSIATIPGTGVVFTDEFGTKTITGRKTLKSILDTGTAEAVQFLNDKGIPVGEKAFPVRHVVIQLDNGFVAQINIPKDEITPSFPVASSVTAGGYLLLGNQFIRNFTLSYNITPTQSVGFVMLWR